MRLILAALLSIVVGLTISPAEGHTQASCELTPLILPLFDGTPVAELVNPTATPSVSMISEEEAAEVLEQYVACTNTGDPTLVWAMFTPRWFSAQFADSEQHYLPAFEYEIATGEHDVVDPLVLVEIHAVEPLDDQRVAVTATFASGDLEWTDQLVLANVDGQWLIDEVFPVSSTD